MDSYQYNLKVAEALKAVRELLHITQEEIAKRTNIPQCTYSKIESGQRPVNLGELHIITKGLCTNTFQIITHIEAKNKVSSDSPTLSYMLINFVKLFEGKINYSEVEKIIKQIKETFEVEKPSLCSYDKCPLNSILTKYSKFE